MKWVVSWSNSNFVAVGKFIVQIAAKVEILKRGKFDVVLYNIETDIKKSHLYFWNRSWQKQKYRYKLMDCIMKDKTVVSCSIKEDSFVQAMWIFPGREE